MNPAESQTAPSEEERASLPEGLPEPGSPEFVAALATFFHRPDVDSLPRRRALTWEVGERAREINERLVDSTATEADLEAVLGDLERVAERLRLFEHGRRYDGYSEASMAGGPPEGHADFSPLIGRANPIAPPLDMDLEGDAESPKLVATVVFGSAYEGPPGCVHGGLVAAAFDEVMGAAQALTGSPGMTGTLTVVYRAPTPLHCPLRFEAQVDGVDGRKITVKATLMAGDLLCAEATAVFISIDFARFAALRAERNDPLPGTGDPSTR